MFFHHLLAGDGPVVYLASWDLRLDSRARLGGFTAALGQVIARHDIFRTSVAWEGLPEPVQVVWRHARLPVTEVTLPRDGDGDSHGDGDRGLTARLLAVAGRRMDLRRAPLLRMLIAAEPGRESRWLALLQVHHLLMDHTTMDV